MARSRVVLPFGLVVIASMIWGPGAALDPLGDDAGSGGDAGDLALLATPVEPGTFSGRLGGPNDLADWYSFHGHAGDKVTIDLRSDSGSLFVPWMELHGPEAATEPFGDLYASVWVGYPTTLILPVNGTWYLQATVLVQDTATTSYGVTLDQQPLDDVFIETVSAPSVTLELRLDEPGDAWFMMRVATTEANADAPFANTILYDYAMSDDTFPSTSAIGGVRLSGTGLGDSWRVDEVGVNGESPIEVVTPSDSGWVQTIGHVDNGTGSFRYTGYFTEHVGDVHLVVWSDRNIERGVGATLNVSSFRTSDLDGVETLAPGFDPGGNRSLTAHLPERTIGWANGGGAAFDATAPDGTRHRSPDAPDDAMSLYHAQPGDWTFAFEPPAHVPDGDRIWLDHVQLPDLGIADPPWASRPLASDRSPPDDNGPGHGVLET